MLDETSTDILVVGAGPAGLSAAVCAAESGRQVTVLDDNLGAGGNIWRGEARKPTVPEAAAWFARVEKAGIKVRHGVRVFEQTETNYLLAETRAGVSAFRYRKLILATGARERFLPFPGWTLPNVMGAGGLQALVKTGLPISDKRVVIAGSGPLLMAVASYLKQHGALIMLIAEQAAQTDVVRFGTQLLRSPGKLAQAFKIKAQLIGTPYLTNCYPIAAEGEGRVQRVRLQYGKQIKVVDCDYLAYGFHLVPNLELATLLGCALRDGCVSVDEFQQTSVADVYTAGETTGIGGLELSLTEGQIAGYAAADNPSRARSFFAQRTKHQKFADALNRAFALREELRSLPQAETIVCRCEDVTFERLCVQPDWRTAKLHTRCGMGPCQGRICGAALEVLLGWDVTSIRPPVFPVRVASLMAGASADHHQTED